MVLYIFVSTCINLLTTLFINCLVLFFSSLQFYRSNDLCLYSLSNASFLSWGSLVDLPLQDFKDGNNYREALLCLNEMVTDALSHGLDCLQYMASLQDPANLRFCAIPQVLVELALQLLCSCHKSLLLCGFALSLWLCLV